MHRDDIEEEAAETHLHRRNSASSPIELGHIITFGLAILINAIMVAFSYGSMMQKVDNNTDAIALFKSRDITPGAERRISVLEVQIIQVQRDSIERWNSFERTLTRMEDKIDKHTDGERR